ncbi:MAG TPA: FAD-dependent oxidoreductase, partial [Thermodesulfobacteriota bacterium]|nr:FAD-dependent oxidoreductase [Thermodesulfobacteriota bacterium]
NLAADEYILDARGMYYQELNQKIRELSDAGFTHIFLKNVRGQRYIGDGITNSHLVIDIEGVPGEDLGYGMGGATIIVHGHGQNAIANTMDSGKIVVYGLAGDALAYGMRGGLLFVRDDVGYRVGIHMKAYKDKSPLVVIGGTSGDFLGEYMAGGTLILLNRNNRQTMVCGESDKTLATGIHGGEIYIFGYQVPDYLLGIGALIVDPTNEDKLKLITIIQEFASDFALDPEPLINRPYIKIIPVGSRPFAKFYFPAYPVTTNLKPERHERTSPCEAACPAGVPTGRFLRYIRQGEGAKALELLDDVTPFRYSCCGFICPHLCMEACTRGKFDFPVRTADLAKRYRIDLPAKKIGNYEGKIAVIGAGPAGLTAAYHLARLGYTVTVYEASDRPGGKMYQVISRTRLPLEDLEHDLKRIEDLGVTFITNTLVDAERFEAILSENDYIVVAVGAHRGIIPTVIGKEYIRAGIDFLKAFNRGEKLNLGEKVFFIGGGDAALDGIEAALQLGVRPQDILVIDIKTPSGNKTQIKQLEGMGVRFKYPVFLQAVTKSSVILKNEVLEEETVPADTVIAFINEVPAVEFLPDNVKPGLDEHGFFTAPHKTSSFRSAHPKISIVGDANSLGLVTTNIGRGRECAREVHALLQGKEYIPLLKDPISSGDLHPERFLAEGSSSMIEEECWRCLHCGVCVQCDECVQACPRKALRREGENFFVDETLCGGCGTCAAACKGGVIQMSPR